MVDAARVLAQLQAETEQMVAATERLARIDSGADAPAGIEHVCELFGEQLAAGGFQTSPGPAGGLRAELALGDGPRLLVIGHADTVWPAGTAGGWAPQRDAGLLSGPGVGDMKGCLVMAAHAIAAARRVDDAGLDGIGAIELLVVADEEQGSVASRDWIEDRAREAGACLGLEAGWPGGGLVVSRGAVGALAVDAIGETAHCAGHEGRGASAVAALAPLVAELESLSRPDEGVLVSVGVFNGGVARQVVPDRARLEIDLRAPSSETGGEALRAIEAIVREAGEGRVGLTLSGGVTRPAFPAQMSAALWKLALRRARELTIPLAAIHSRGGSDASFAAALGVPTLDGLGPICHDSCARGERIEIESLAQRGALMALLICDLASGWRQARASGKVDAPA
ncbi:MAG: M20/M25/M40 family metallo-hydrolase [Solirubrobacteraceae bacterium]